MRRLLPFQKKITTDQNPHFKMNPARRRYSKPDWEGLGPLPVMGPQEPYYLSNQISDFERTCFSQNFSNPHLRKRSFNNFKVSVRTNDSSFHGLRPLSFKKQNPYQAIGLLSATNKPASGSFKRGSVNDSCSTASPGHFPSCEFASSHQLPVSICYQATPNQNMTRLSPNTSQQASLNRLSIIQQRQDPPQEKVALITPNPNPKPRLWSFSQMQLQWTKQKFGPKTICKSVLISNNSKVIKPTGQTIQKSFSYLHPFSRSVIVYRENLAKTPRNNLFKRTWNMRKFFHKMFLFESTNLPDPSAFNSLELSVLKEIFNTKKYFSSLGTRFVFKSEDLTKNSNFTPKIFRYKRKEENIKYGFRVVWHSIFPHFQEFILQKNWSEFLTPEIDQKALFYLAFFSQTEFDLPPNDAYAKFFRDKNFRKLAANKLRKYYFPEMNKINSQAKSKTLNKKLFNLLSHSLSFLEILNKSITSFLVYLGDPRFYSRDLSLFRQQPEGNSRMEVRLMNVCVETNHREITKMFSEWDNLTRQVQIKSLGKKKNNWKEGKSGESEEEVSDSMMFELISKNVHKLNFKFPWGLAEIRNSFLEAFFWLNENVFPSLKIKNYESRVL